MKNFEMETNNQSTIRNNIKNVRMEVLKEKRSSECGRLVLMCLCLLTGKRIPVADAAGGTSGKGFKLGRQASESRRTCC